jgi:branched-chain amino acid transport system ATP-binding protein
VALAVADRVTVLHGGEILVDGTPNEIRRDPRVTEIYIGVDLLADDTPVTPQR